MSDTRHGEGPGGSPMVGLLDTAALLVDAEGRITSANAPALRLCGRGDAELAGQVLVSCLFDPDEQGQLEEVIRLGLQGRTWRGRLRMRHGDGSTPLVEVCCSPLWREGRVTGLAVLIEAAPADDGASHENRRLRERLSRLTRITSELAAAETIEGVSQIVVAHSADAVGATLGSLSLRDQADRDLLRLVGLGGGSPEDRARYATYPVTAANPAAEAVRTGRRVIVTGRDEITRRYADVVDRGERSIVCLPLHGAAGTIGAIGLSFPGVRLLDAAELEFFDVLADTCAQALERIAAQEVADLQTVRLTFLVDAATELSSSLDYEATLKGVAQLAVPRFADWAAIDLVDDGVLRRLAVAHVDPDKVRLATELAERYPPDPESPNGPWEVMRTGQSQLLAQIPDELLAAGAVDEEHLRILRDLRLRSAITVPLIARGRVLGVFTWVSAESGRTYTEQDLALAEDLAKRAAIAIDNAELHSQTMAAATELQRAVLPDAMPETPGWDLAAYYNPSGRTEVGGDFYDAIPLEDGSLVLFVGDVMGRGVDAAAAMAQMRAAVRAYVAINPTPEVVMGRFDRMFGLFPSEQLVTLVYLLVEPARDRLTWANAGHPPPVLLRADGGTEQLPLAEGAPLGTVPQERYQDSVRFEPGDAVVIFTDGLIERRDEDISAGQARVLDAVPDLAREDLSGALNDVAKRLQDPSRDDDVAVLAARRHLR